MMNVYEAIMKAADHIERNPHLFDFDKERVPDCGTPGCALGWTAHFMGYLYTNVGVFAEMALPVHTDQSAEGAFYDRMDAVLSDRFCDWIAEPAMCAKGMRLLAEKHYGHLKYNFARELEQTLLTHQPEVA
jgi:hypothetical protein